MGEVLRILYRTTVLMEIAAELNIFVYFSRVHDLPIGLGASKPELTSMRKKTLNPSE